MLWRAHMVEGPVAVQYEIWIRIDYGRGLNGGLDVELGEGDAAHEGRHQPEGP